VPGWHRVSIYPTLLLSIVILVIVEKLRTDTESLPRQDLDPVSNLAITFQKDEFPLCPEPMTLLLTSQLAWHSGYCFLSG
jgi:hypothetical protein